MDVTDAKQWFRSDGELWAVNMSCFSEHNGRMRLARARSELSFAGDLTDTFLPGEFKLMPYEAVTDRRRSMNKARGGPLPNAVHCCAASGTGSWILMARLQHRLTRLLNGWLPSLRFWRTEGGSAQWKLRLHLQLVDVAIRVDHVAWKQALGPHARIWAAATARSVSAAMR